jgi:hypothetical protein
VHTLSVAGDLVVNYSLDPLARIVYIAYPSNPTYEEWAAMMEAIFQEAQYAPGWGFLADRRSLTEAPSKDFIESALRFVSSHQTELAGARWASVVSGPAAYGMVRMGQALADELLKVGVFTDLGEAREWLERGA